jgi:hypothetical protein
MPHPLAPALAAAQTLSARDASPEQQRGETRGAQAGFDPSPLQMRF